MQSTHLKKKTRYFTPNVDLSFNLSKNMFFLNLPILNKNLKYKSYSNFFSEMSPDLESRNFFFSFIQHIFTNLVEKESIFNRIDAPLYFYLLKFVILLKIKISKFYKTTSTQLNYAESIQISNFNFFFKNINFWSVKTNLIDFTTHVKQGSFKSSLNLFARSNFFKNYHFFSSFFKSHSLNFYETESTKQLGSNNNNLYLSFGVKKKDNFSNPHFKFNVIENAFHKNLNLNKNYNNFYFGSLQFYEIKNESTLFDEFRSDWVETEKNYQNFIKKKIIKKLKDGRIFSDSSFTGDITDEEIKEDESTDWINFLHLENNFKKNKSKKYSKRRLKFFNNFKRKKKKSNRKKIKNFIIKPLSKKKKLIIKGTLKKLTSKVKKTKLIKINKKNVKIAAWSKSEKKLKLSNLLRNIHKKFINLKKKIKKNTKKNTKIRKLLTCLSFNFLIKKQKSSYSYLKSSPKIRNVYNVFFKEKRYPRGGFKSTNLYTDTLDNLFFKKVKITYNNFKSFFKNSLSLQTGVWKDLFFLFMNPLFFKLFFVVNKRWSDTLSHVFTFLEKHSQNFLTNLFINEEVLLASLKKFLNFSLKSKISQIFFYFSHVCLIKFLEHCSNKKIMFRFDPFVFKNISEEDKYRCSLWAPHLKEFKKSMGPRFFLVEALNIMTLTLRLQDPYILSNWMLSVFYKMSFWKYKSLFNFMQYALRYFFWPHFSEYDIKGLRFQLKGKVSVAGNGRTRTVRMQIGSLGHSKSRNKILTNLNLLRTFTGVIGFQTWMVF